MNKTIKKLLTATLCLIVAIAPLTACKSAEDYKVIELNEVTHSVFYAPLYVAIENGYFEEEKIKINLTNGGGANNSMTAVLSGTAQIGLMGPETVIYVYNQGKKDCPKVIGQLTQKDGSFLVSRTPAENFQWSDLQGKDILAGRRGGVPAMTFSYMLKELGLNENEDFTLNYDVQFNLMTSAFIQGTSDYCTVFEPTASEYEKNGTWHVVASVGQQAGEIPYTSFIALDSFVNNNADTVRSFMKALKKAHEFMAKSTDREIAESIVKQFPSTSITSIETSVASYKKIDAWKTDLIPTAESFDRLQEIMKNAGELTEKVAFDKITNYKIAREVFGK